MTGCKRRIGGALVPARIMLRETLTGMAVAKVLYHDPEGKA